LLAYDRKRTTRTSAISGVHGRALTAGTWHCTPVEGKNRYGNDRRCGNDGVNGVRGGKGSEERFCPLGWKVLCPDSAITTEKTATWKLQVTREACYIYDILQDLQTSLALCVYIIILATNT